MTAGVPSSRTRRCARPPSASSAPGEAVSQAAKKTTCGRPAAASSWPRRCTSRVPFDAIQPTAGGGEKQTGLPVASVGRAMADHMHERIALGHDTLAECVEGRRPNRAGRVRQEVTRDCAEGRGQGRHGLCRVERLQAVLLQTGWAGDNYQGAQVKAADGRKAPVGNSRQVKREEGTLLKGEEGPPTVERAAQALPMQRLQAVVLDAQQHSKGVAGCSQGLHECIAHWPGEERLAEDPAITQWRALCSQDLQVEL